MMPTKTPSERYGAADRDVEIGATSGASHTDLLMRQLGHDEGLSLATGVSYQKPLVVDESQREGEREGKT